jgi:hypothetical protein
MGVWMGWHIVWTADRELWNSSDFTLNSGIPVCSILTYKWFCPNTEWGQNTNTSEGLNRNFSTKSQNRIGFKFGFCTCLSVLIVTFVSYIRLQLNWWSWKENKKWNKYWRNIFFLIMIFTMSKLPHNKRLQFRMNLESFSYLDWSFNLLLGQEDSSDDFYEIPRASRPLLVPINKPLSFKRMCAYA